MSAPRRITEAEIAAYLDNELAADERRDVDAWIASSPENTARIEQHRLLATALKSWAATLPLGAVPPGMLNTARKIEQRGATKPTNLRRMAAAAAIAGLAMVGGYAAHRALDPAARPEPGFVANALGAHAVYMPEVRHPVEVTSADEKHLVDWLTKRVGTEVKAPQLAKDGWTLVGGRLLPDQGQAAAQLMYEDTRGRRLTLYMRQEPNFQSSSFRYGESGALTAVYWVDRPLAYAITSNIARDELMPIALKIYALLERPIDGNTSQKEPRGSKE